MLTDKLTDPGALSPLTLAFVGDTVFDLLVRGLLVCEANRPVKDLHRAASEKVCASSQAYYIKNLLPQLTEQESEIFRRGRNANPSGHPKNQSAGDYHYATGFECLLGWLYLRGDEERIKEIFALITEAENGKIED